MKRNPAVEKNLISGSLSGVDLTKTFRGMGIQGKALLLILIVLVPVLFIEAFIYCQRFETRKSEELQANLEVARGGAQKFEIVLSGSYPHSGG